MGCTWTTPAGTIQTIYKDMLAQPHLLIAGATGSGKSVVINALIYTALYKFPHSAESPKNVGFILIDNGKGTEMIDYKDLPHTLRYAYTLEESISALEYGLSIAKDRFSDMRRRHLKNYDGGDIYIFIDEFASLILNGKKRISAIVQDITQLGRAAGVHIILATQCPIAKIVPTEIKISFNARVGLHTATAQDSRNILGMTGCEHLPRYGQGYYMTPEGVTLYNIPMIPKVELSARVQWWMDQKPKGFFTRLFGR